MVSLPTPLMSSWKIYSAYINRNAGYCAVSRQGSLHLPVSHLPSFVNIFENLSFFFSLFLTLIIVEMEERMQKVTAGK